MSKKKKVKDRPEASDRSAPPPSPAPTMQLPGVAASTSIVNSSDPAIQPEVPTPSVEDLMRDTTNAMGNTSADPATDPPSVAGSDEAEANAIAQVDAISQIYENPDADALNLGAITADRYRLILALERAAIYGHGLDSDRALHMEAAAMIRALLDLAPDADLTQPYTTGPVANDPPIGHSL